MTFARVAPRLLIPLAAALALACGDDDNLPDPTDQNRVDTLTIGSLTGTPIATPSGYAVEKGTVRTDLDAGFDFAYNIESGGRQVFVPRAALGLPSQAADPGLQRRSEAFSEIVVAPSNGYVTEEPVPIAVGERYVVRSRVICGALGVPLYAKIEILGFDANLVTLQVLANRNCGYKGLEPGFPDR